MPVYVPTERERHCPLVGTRTCDYPSLSATQKNNYQETSVNEPLPVASVSGSAPNPDEYNSDHPYICVQRPYGKPETLHPQPCTDLGNTHGFCVFEGDLANQRHNSICDDVHATMIQHVCKFPNPAHCYTSTGGM